MIKVSLANIRDFGLPLDNTSKIVKRGNSKRILKKLEKKYGLKSHVVCRKMFGTYEFYCNVANNYVPNYYGIESYQMRNGGWSPSSLHR